MCASKVDCHSWLVNIQLVLLLLLLPPPCFLDKTFRGAGIYYLKIGLLYYSNPNIPVSPYNVERSGLLL